MKKGILFCTALVLMFAAAPAAHACRIIKMTNNTGSTVDDLHFETTQGPATVNFAPLPNGGSITVTLTIGSCDHIKILHWWWTTGGARTGPINHGEPQASLTIGGSGATGNGSVRVHIGTSDFFFAPTPGDSPAQTATKFQSFLAGLTVSGNPATYFEASSATSVNFFGNVLGDPSGELVSNVNAPDNTQILLVAMGITELPALGAIGIAVLALVLFVTGALWLGRRKRGLAF